MAFVKEPKGSITLGGVEYHLVNAEENNTFIAMKVKMMLMKCKNGGAMIAVLNGQIVIGTYDIRNKMLNGSRQNAWSL